MRHLNRCVWPATTLAVLFFLSSLRSVRGDERTERLFAQENLVAWCIVPFDAKKRGPEDRAEMLQRLGFRKFAYDYRAEHVPTFDAEMAALKKRGIELTAWWFPGTLNEEAKLILDVLKRHQLRPQLWVTGGGGPTANADEQRQRVVAETARLRPIALAAAEIGCSVGLYNHGGWFGDPVNQIAIIQELGLSNVGIVYNQHHGHDDLERFAKLLELMQPHLYCLNLNGMEVAGDRHGRKILPLGQGDLDLRLLTAIAQSSYSGPIGILGHTQDDAEQRLQDNLDGLRWLTPQLGGAAAPPKPQPRTPVPAKSAAAPARPSAKPPTKNLKEDHWGIESVGFAWTEQDSVDDRWNQTDVGPFLASIVPLPDRPPVAKGLSLRIGAPHSAAPGTICYDTHSCAVAAAWTDGFLRFHPARYGLIQPPAVAGKLAYVSRATAGWTGGPVQYRGLQLHGDRFALHLDVGGVLVRDAPWLEIVQDQQLFTRDLLVAASPNPPTCVVGEFRGAAQTVAHASAAHIEIRNGDRLLIWRSVGPGRLRLANDAPPGSARVLIEFPLSSRESATQLIGWEGSVADRELGSEALAACRPPSLEFSRPPRSVRRWTDQIVTQGIVSPTTDRPFVIDTLTLPFDNPYRALFFVSGHDFLANGDVVLCTVHGDVWMVRGVDERLQRLQWRRFATGLFQPLGLKILAGQIYVLGRDQITRLVDHDGDDEADEYQCFSNLHHTSPGGHDYVTCLEADSCGNFYLAHATEGVVRISADGTRKETVATGLRNPNGLSVGPGDVITAAPQEGEWTPGSCVIEVREGGHYGYQGPRPGHGADGVDPPLCWLPRSIDNSCGGQAWVTSAAWSPLAGQLLHFAYGKCRMLLVLRDRPGDGPIQGAAVEFPLDFDSGIARGRFSPRDGQLYVSGLKGWVTSAVQDGCLQRVRYTGAPVALPTAWRAHANGIAISFADALDPRTATDPGSYRMQQWNYRYSAAYGSADWKLTAPDQQGRDDVPIESVALVDDHTVFLEIPSLRPSQQFGVEYSLRSAQGTPLRQALYGTIHATTAEPREVRGARRQAAAARTGVPDEARPGVVFRAADQVQVHRMAAWTTTAEPHRPSAVPRQVSGFVRAPLRGEYRFHVTGRGSARLSIRGAAVWEATGDLAAQTPASVELEQGLNSFELIYTAAADQLPGFRLWWSDDTFAPEPVPATVLFHDPHDPALVEVEQRQAGERLFDQHRCAACHSIAPAPADAETGAAPLEAGPDLTGVGRRLTTAWVQHWLLRPGELRDDRQMPQFLDAQVAADRQHAADLAAYLATLVMPPGEVRQSGQDARATSSDPAAPAGESAAGDPTAIAKRGGELYLQLGCVACHREDDPAEPDGLSRISLRWISAKFSASELIAFLRRPGRHYPATRMPDFRLSVEEATALAAHLRREARTLEPLAEAGDAARGKTLFQSHRCGSCHGVDHGAVEPTAKIAVADKPPAAGCLSADPRASARPRFDFSPAERDSLQAYLRAANQSTDLAGPALDAEQLVQMLRCTACHDRDAATAPFRYLVAEETGVFPEVLPNLTWTGEKLWSDWVRRLLAGEQPTTTRPWLTARMPAFPHYADRLAAGLAQQHGAFPTPTDADRPPVDAAQAALGDQLTRKERGLDCRQCHAIGAEQPLGDDRTKIALGINFLLTRDRLRREFYDRFVLDPPRYDIGTKMPKLSPDGRHTKVTAFHDGDAPRQFQSIWHFIQSLGESR